MLAVVSKNKYAFELLFNRYFEPGKYDFIYRALKIVTKNS